MRSDGSKMKWGKWNEMECLKDKSELERKKSKMDKWKWTNENENENEEREVIHIDCLLFEIIDCLLFIICID
jgi:hypothetical protein